MSLYVPPRKYANRNATVYAGSIISDAVRFLKPYIMPGVESFKNKAIDFLGRKVTKAIPNIKQKAVDKFDELSTSD